MKACRSHVYPPPSKAETMQKAGTMSSQKVSFSFVFQQGTMLKTLGGIALSGVLPKGRTRENPQEFEPAQMVIPAPDAQLVDAYAAWSGARASQYVDTLPPHFLSQWALPAASRVLRQSRYDIASIINQGVD